MWQYQNTDELYHHGVLGMKWGRRRYQNKDGSLTPAGKKRANKLLKQYSKVTGKKIIIKKKTVEGNHEEKTIKDMTNEELKSRTTRMNLESDYINAKTRLSSLTKKPETKQQVSKGKQFTNKVMKEVVGPSAVQAGKTVLQDWLTKVGKEYAGLSNKQSNPLSSLENKNKKLRLEKENLEYEKTIEELAKKAKAKNKK